MQDESQLKALLLPIVQYFPSCHILDICYFRCA
jgi:hypothetical protein